MNNFFYFIILFLSFINIKAQHDTDHWFAPMVASSANPNNRQAVYLSTDSTIPFDVTIYNNNTAIGTVNISKGNPQKYDIPLAMMIGMNASDAMSVKTRGLYLHGDFPFFATFRFSETNHGEILTSKGSAALGTKFYAVYAPLTNNQSSQNFSVGVLATENNTQVTVSGYNQTTWFVNNFNGLTHPSITITLNKGQSYVFEGLANKPGNQTGFIGAKITSTKPITVTNGNYHGQFGTFPPFNGEDIIMDQSVPVERLGDEFVMVRGMGDLLRDIEGAVIVATENNTEVRINGNATPVAVLNEGQFYRVSVTNYIQNGAGHFNMHIKTTKNAYVYQLLSGIAQNDATEGFNYIPPLNCFLPKKIDEIGMVGELPYYTTFDPPLIVKMNILTQAGAAVLVNGGTPTAAQGPFPVTGTTNWVTYTIPNVTGNMTIESSMPVTAGIVGGSGNLGYGGYFAGVNSVPVITKTGDCVPGAVLSVTSGFTSYQWNLNGTPIPGATTSTFTPTTGGNYTVTIVAGGCSPLTTYPFKIKTCLAQTVKNISLCSTAVVTNITPAFTNSAQIPVPASVQIITPPANGNLIINSTTGVLTYTPNAGTTTDVFVYKFCGNDPDFTDCEQVTVNISVQPLVLNNATVKACNVNGQGTFDLTQAAVGGPATTVKKYYPTMADLTAGTNEILNPTNYLSAPGNVYVKVTTLDGCTDSTKITLEFFAPVNTIDITLNGCFLPNDITKAEFDLTTANVSPGAANVKYYPSLTDAQNSTNEIQPANSYISTNAEVFARITSVNGCIAFAKITLKVIEPNPSAVLTDVYVCPNNKTSLDAGPGYTAYLWSTGATTQAIQNVGVGEYWVILSSRGCQTKQTVKVLEFSSPKIEKIEVKENSATIYAIGGTQPYQYSTDDIFWQNSNEFKNLPRGKNTFFVRDVNSCSSIQASVTISNISNALTPNFDGVNDVWDYSELSYLEKFEIEIIDRYGAQIFKSKQGNYKWDGTVGGRPANTGTYWYKMTWVENGTSVTYSGWLLVKNR